MDRLPEWCTKQEVATHWRLSLRTLERRIKVGLLRAVTNGRLVRIKREWVLECERRLEEGS